MSAVNVEESLNGIQEEISGLAEALAESPEYLAFERARERLEEDEDAQYLIREFEQQQQFLQTFGGFQDVMAQAEFEELRRRMLGHPTVSAYLTAQERLAKFFRQVSQIISEVVGIDFAAACSPSAGCC